MRMNWRERMTAEECADYLGLDVQRIYTLARRKKIPCVRMGRSWWFYRDAIDEWMVAQMGVFTNVLDKMKEEGKEVENAET